MKKWKQRFRNKRLEKLLKPETEKLSQTLSTHFKDAAPVILVSYNNAKYLELSISQLNTYGITPIILDNASNDVSTVNFLNTIDSQQAHLIKLSKNFGHLVGFIEPIYNLLPNLFAYSDPDLKYNESLPTDFLSQLCSLTEEYKVFKAGFALDLHAEEEIIKATIPCKKIKPITYQNNFNIREWEAQFWRHRLQNKAFEIYAAKIDTTFAVCNKNNYQGDFFDAVRVAGNFSCTHLPWFPKLDIMSTDEKTQYLKGNKSTSWVK